MLHVLGHTEAHDHVSKDNDRIAERKGKEKVEDKGISLHMDCAVSQNPEGKHANDEQQSHEELRPHKDGLVKEINNVRVLHGLYLSMVELNGNEGRNEMQSYKDICEDKMHSYKGVGVLFEGRPIHNGTVFSLGIAVKCNPIKSIED